MLLPSATGCKEVRKEGFRLGYKVLGYERGEVEHEHFTRLFSFFMTYFSKTDEKVLLIEHPRAGPGWSHLLCLCSRLYGMSVVWIQSAVL